MIQALRVLCSQGYFRDGMRTIAFCCRHDFWVIHSLAGEGCMRSRSCVIFQTNSLTTHITFAYRVAFL